MPIDVDAIAIAWYRENDYESLKAMFVDGHRLPATFAQWHDQAEQIRQGYISQGNVVVQAYIDPHTFPDWCAANGCDIDADGRTKFANAEACRVLMEADKHG